MLSNATTVSMSDGHQPARARKEFGLVQIHPRTPTAAPRVWEVAGTTLVGRAAECLVRVEDTMMSRVHARTEPTHHGLSVLDLGSRHGSYLDGQRLSRTSPTNAAPGCVLRCGETILLVVENPARYDVMPHRVARESTDLPSDTLAGPDLGEALEAARQAGPLEHPIMILGESGVGKEIVARCAHLARAKPSPFVAVNVAAIPEGLFEAELFGHARGAFSGATSERLGMFREAGDGTLFLDEVGDLRGDLQAKLLRAIEAKRVRPLGVKQDVAASPRLITATSRDLEEAIKVGTFRADLFYRLSGVVIRVPPLRDRRDDILLLATEKLAQEAPGLALSGAAAEQLALGCWEGNVRELNHTLLRAMLQAAREGSTRLLPTHLPRLAEPPSAPEQTLNPDSLRQAMADAGGEPRMPPSCSASHAPRSITSVRATASTWEPCGQRLARTAATHPSPTSNSREPPSGCSAGAVGSSPTTRDVVA